MTRHFIAGDLARRLSLDGHEVKLQPLCEHEKAKCSFDGMIEKTTDWKHELSWVGKDGLIIFDDIGFGKIQDELRVQGFQVFGGSEGAEKLEIDREYGQKIFKEHGLQTVPLFNFSTPQKALSFLEKNPGRWVIKQNDHISKDITYIGYQETGDDVISVLENYACDPLICNCAITLHKYVEGIEIGVGRYFNGNDWVGPIEINLEHKRFFPGDLGPMTSEMGTLAWYSDDEEVLFEKILKPLTQFLRTTNFRGDFEINCMANKDGLFPIEATTRFGTPIIHLQQEIHQSSWAEFLLAVARGESFDLDWKRGFGVVILLAVPPFPYTTSIHRAEHTYNNISIYLNQLSVEEKKHFYFEDVTYDADKKRYRISGDDGYVGYVASVAETVLEAQKKVYDIAKKIIIPKVMYRNDIGTAFIEGQYQQLKDWGYLK